jgi:hypothetical protein
MTATIRSPSQAVSSEPPATQAMLTATSKVSSQDPPHLQL